MIADCAAAERSEIASSFINSAKPLSPTVPMIAQGEVGEITAEDLERVVGSDPELSLRVLALANSAFYSQLHDISTLRSALVVLGADTVRKLAASLLARSLLSARTPADFMIWRHSQAVGIAAQQIAEVHRCIDPEQAFVAGLLHDIGLSAVLAYELSTIAGYEAHAEIGAEIAESLGLSPNLVPAIRFHDYLAEGAEVGALEITVFVANQIAIRSGFNHEMEDAEDDDRFYSATELLDLEAADIEALAIGLPGRIEAFETAIGSAGETSL